MRFKKLKYGMYLDTETDLLWHPEQRIFEHDEGLEFAASLDTAGLIWRVPTRIELLSIVDDECYNPASKLPDMRDGNYWSSSSYAFSTAFAWFVLFYVGYSGSSNRTNGFYVRCVAGPVDDSVIKTLMEPPGREKTTIR